MLTIVVITLQWHVVSHHGGGCEQGWIAVGAASKFFFDELAEYLFLQLRAPYHLEQ